jgi:two-component system NarL family sensor kinase
MRKKLGIGFCLIMLWLQSSAQLKRIDSLKHTLKGVSVNEKAINLNRISNIYLNHNIDSGILYANRAVALAEKNNIYDQLAIAYNYLGQFMYYKSNYQSSLAYFEKFKSTALLAKNENLLVQAINNAANVLIDLGETDNAIKSYEEVLRISKKNNNKAGQSLAYANLAYVSRYIGNYSKAIPYLFEKIKIDEGVKNNKGLAFSYQQLAVLYCQKSDYAHTKEYLDLSLAKYKELNDARSIAVNYDIYSSYFIGIKDQVKAIEYQKMALAMAEKLADKRSMASFQIKLGQLYYLDKAYTQSALYFQDAIKLHEQINLQKTLATGYIGYGKTLLKLNRLELAKQYLDKGLTLANSLKSSIDKKDAYEGLTEYYIVTSQSDKALKSQSDFISIKDSLLNEGNSKQINELNTIYNTEKKQQQILLLSKENQIQGLQLGKSTLELENKSLENDRNVFKIGTQDLLLQKNKVELGRKQAEAKAKAQQIKLLASENEIQRLELIKRNVFLLSILGLLIIIVVMAYLFYNRYKLKQEARLQAEVIAQQDLATKAVLNAEENERKRISGELHDGLGQMFSAVKLNLSAITDNLMFLDEHSKKVFHRTISLVDESCKEVRVISHQMAPNVLLKSGLAAAVKDFINKIDSRKLRINLETFSLQHRIDQNIETVLYRVIQETVNNVIKHSEANELDIQLNRDDDGINVMIEDNGKGFDSSSIEKFEGIGLKNIRSRVEYLKGSVDFSSKIGSGTLVAIYIPL